jgi:hypothetical protein
MSQRSEATRTDGTAEPGARAATDAAPAMAATVRVRLHRTARGDRT